jgi:hypothetical protein
MSWNPGYCGCDNTEMKNSIKEKKCRYIEIWGDTDDSCELLILDFYGKMHQPPLILCPSVMIRLSSSTY